MRQVIMKSIESWRSRVTVPQTMHESAPLLLDSWKRLNDYQCRMESWIKVVGVDQSFNENAYVQGAKEEVKRIELLYRSIEELLLKWGFDPAEIVRVL